MTGLGTATGWAVVANNALNVLQVIALAYIAALVRNGRRRR